MQRRGGLEGGGAEVRDAVVPGGGGQLGGGDRARICGGDRGSIISSGAVRSMRVSCAGCAREDRAVLEVNVVVLVPKLVRERDGEEGQQPREQAGDRGAAPIFRCTPQSHILVTCR